MTCWEVLHCGKENECPAYPKSGACCWSVTGTLCCGNKRGTYDDKVRYCRAACKFYKGVMVGSISVVS